MSRQRPNNAAMPGPGSNPSRRFSQPAYPTQPGLRRASEATGIPRADTLPTAPLGGDDRSTSDKSSRKPRGTKDGSELGSTYDPERFNPDGSLRTVHRIPSFDEAYAQAGRARYIRHKELIDREKELSIKQIFDKNP